jgi:cellobiose phosphorylase
MPKFGHFSPDGREYIITNWNTPRPWVNYLTNGRYTSIHSHVGTGYSFLYDGHYNPVSNLGINLVFDSFPGKFLYVRDNDSGEYFSVTVGPCLKKPDSYEARVGLGYSVIISSYMGINGSITYFIDEEDNAEVWMVDITNNSRKPRSLSLFSFADLLCGELGSEFYGSGWFAHTYKQLRYENGALLGTKEFVGRPDGKGMMHWPYQIFVTSTLKPAGYEASKEKFIGTFRTLQNPIAVETNKVSGKDVSGEPLAATLKWNLSLKPGQTKRFAISMGFAPWADAPATDRIVKKFQSLDACTAAQEKSQSAWRARLDNIQINTPDKFMNIDANCWVKYQTMINYMTWRNTNWYYGVGPDGNGAGGYRNILCDALGALPFDPAGAREHINIIARYQTSQGLAAHSAPRPELGVAPRSIGSKVDDPLWLAYDVSEYIKETGDGSILSEEIPYMNDGKTGPMWEHISAGIDQMIDTAGDKGLPLIGHGDWNDALNGVGPGGKGQTVWQGMFLAYILRITCDIVKRYVAMDGALTGKINRYTAKADELTRIINDQCFNGEYYVRAYKDDGSPVGDKSCTEGKIYLEAQTWAVITGTADTKRANKTMDSTIKLLNTEYGLEILWPTYTKYDPTVGVISAFSPGTHENAAVFSHANTFAVVALAMLGRAEEAYELYKKVAPVGNSDKFLARRELEPYAHCQYLEGRSSKLFGKGSCHWLTGTAAWMLKAISEWMLGVRPDYDGLIIDPCIPKAWKGFSMTRQFRGDTFIIDVKNPSHVNQGVKQILVDGVEIGGSMIRPIGDGKEHRVAVTMGK